MEIRVVDFEIVTRHFTKYQEGINKIEERKNQFLSKIEPYRKEMENIILSAQSGLVIDQMTQQQRSDKFQHMQKEIMELDKVFKSEVAEMRSELSKTTYEVLRGYIAEWSENNNIDLVMGKVEIVCCKDIFDVTGEILEILKEKDQYSEYVEEEEVN